jgi:hypothetical protein
LDSGLNLFLLNGINSVLLDVSYKPLSYLENGKIYHIPEQNTLARIYGRNPILFSLISGTLSLLF